MSNARRAPACAFAASVVYDDDDDLSECMTQMLSIKTPSVAARGAWINIISALALSLYSPSRARN